MPKGCGPPEAGSLGPKWKRGGRNRPSLVSGERAVRPPVCVCDLS